MNYKINDAICARIAYDGVTIIVGNPPAWLLRCNLWDHEATAIREAIEGPGYPTRPAFRSTGGVEFGHVDGLALLSLPCERSHPNFYGPCAHTTHTSLLDPEDVLRLWDALSIQAAP